MGQIGRMGQVGLGDGADRLPQPASVPSVPLPSPGKRRHFPRLRHDRRLVRAGGWLIGVDEAGRGAWAGPVVAAAVAVPCDFLSGSWCRRVAPWVDDSKRVDANRREKLMRDLMRPAGSGHIGIATGEACVAEIENLNVLGATRLAMQRALAAIEAMEGMPRLPRADEDEDQLRLFGEGPPAGPPVTVLVDGLPLRPFPYRHRALVRGDGASFVVALASIVAKVTRDRWMEALELRLPGWGWSGHKGYGVPVHAERIAELGPTPEHRPAFLRNLVERIAVERTEVLFEWNEDVAEVEA